jgi:hypothetical protein
MWRDAASVRIKLKVPATQRDQREHAVHAYWLAVSQVRFLYGLSMYYNIQQELLSTTAMTCQLTSHAATRKLGPATSPITIKGNVRETSVSSLLGSV